MSAKRVNFSQSEKLFLMEIVKNHKDKNVLLSQNNSAAISRVKEIAWKEITLKLNLSEFAGKNWDEKQVKSCFFNIRKNAKKEVADFKSSTKSTGGGPPPQKVSELTEIVFEEFGEDVKPLSSDFDSDKLFWDSTETLDPDIYGIGDTNFAVKKSVEEQGSSGNDESTPDGAQSMDEVRFLEVKPKKTPGQGKKKHERGD